MASFLNFNSIPFSYLFAAVMFTIPLYFHFGTSVYPSVVSTVLAGTVLGLNGKFGFRYYSVISAIIFLVLFQLLLLSALNINYFMYRVFAVLIFYTAVYVGYILYSDRCKEIYWLVFILVLAYGIYAAPSYAFGYDKYLFIGTCEPRNISSIGLLRCATFQEGNYYGTYIALSIIIMGINIKTRWPFLLAIVISFSPIALAVYLLSWIRSKLTINLNFIIIIAMLIAWLCFEDFIKPNLPVSETSSFRERFETARIGVFMFIDNPLIGVGFGQYPESVANYSYFQHIINKVVIEDQRVIANSGLPDLLSEQGLFGFLVLFFVLCQLDLISIFLLAIISLAVPTIFQTYIGFLIGIIIKIHSNGKKKKNIHKW